MNASIPSRKQRFRWLPALLGLILGPPVLAAQSEAAKPSPPKPVPTKPAHGKPSHPLPLPTKPSPPKPVPTKPSQSLPAPYDLGPSHPLSREKANPRLLQHSNYFLDKPKLTLKDLKDVKDPEALLKKLQGKPVIYDLQARHWPLTQYPSNLGYRPYLAVGYDLANMTLLVGMNAQGNKEFVIIDSLGGVGTATQALSDLAKVAYGKATPPKKLPIRAIIYTHNHIDHTGGVQGSLALADRPPCLPESSRSAGRDGYYNTAQSAKLPDGTPCVAIISHEKVNSAVTNTATIVGTAIDPRSGYMYGNFVPQAHINSGIGPAEIAESNDGLGSTYQMPSRTFTNTLDVTAAGINMRLIYSPSETDDELVVFVPDKYNAQGAKVQVTGKEGDWDKGPGLLQSAETIQGPSFPNLYSLRGTSYRDPSNWYKSLDVMRGLNSWCMVPSHGPPLCEQNNIQLLLTNYRDAIQFTNDQAIRFINRGYTLDELADLPGLQLPDYLVENLDNLKLIQNEGLSKDQWVVNPQDYLTFFYGSVAQGVREIYAGKLGWFQADPVALQPVPQQEAAKRYVKLMGGSKSVLAAAAKALADARTNKNAPPGSADWRTAVQWSAELSTLVIRAGIKDPNYPTSVTRTEGSPPTLNAACLNVGDESVTLARRLKAEALAFLAQVEINPNWRNWYAASSRELECVLPIGEVIGGLASPGIIQGLPASDWVSSLGLRLKAENTEKLTRSLGIFISDDYGPTGRQSVGFILQIRGVVAQFIQTDGTTASVKQGADIAITLDRLALNTIIKDDGQPVSAGGNSLKRAFQNQVDAQGSRMMLKGSTDDLLEFADYFDTKPITVPVLSGR